MGWIKAGLAEAIGLFVDDGSLAAAVLAWLAVCWSVLPRLERLAGWRAGLLFIGLVAILAESSLRRAGGSHKKNHC